LELLKTEYPGALDLRSLQFAADNLGYPMPEGALEAHLSYLQEKGYVTVERREGFGFRIAFASLSANGWDLIDGFREDSGIARAL
jgi:DNA-binding transcriptional ArsR family regulator